MAIQLSDILKETKTVSFDYDGETCTIEYRHKALTPVVRMLLWGGNEAIRARKTPPAEPPAPSKKRGKAALVEEQVATWKVVFAEHDEYMGTVAGLLVSWDVMDGASPLPITVEGLSQLPGDFIKALANAMLSDGLPNPQSGENSPGTSPQTD